MKIALFHYHLKSGGITDVIVNSVRNLLSRYTDLTEIRLVSGVQGGSDLVLDRIRTGFDRPTADKVRLDVLEELVYNHDSGKNEIDMLAAKLEARYDDETLWWVHNYHIGENPIFTAAIMKIAESGHRDILLHIHDFPECGRIGNLKLMDAVLPNPPYPSGPRIRYAVVNERDREILSDAGLGESVHLLLNPVPLTPVEFQDTELATGALEKHGGVFGYIPGAPIILYPARAERHKNILEAALVTRLLEEPTNLIVTHPGMSAPEKAYSNKVESAYRDGLIPGFWCPESTNDPNLVFSMLVSSCSAVISTSVREGFGYMYMEALHWQKPLLARYLDVMDGILDLFGDYPRRFWADLRIPSTTELAGRTRNAYTEKIRNAAPWLPGKSLKSMLAAASKISAGGGIDVSYLSVDDQLEVLKKARNDKGWLEDARSLNRELLDSLNRTLMAKAPNMDRLLEAHFGEGAYIRRFGEIVGDFGTKRPAPGSAKIRESVSKAFGRIDYMRLLFGG